MKCLIPNAPNDVSWTQLTRPFNVRPLASTLLQFVNTLAMGNSVPIDGHTSIAVALVGQNLNRALLIIQNNSTATTAGDTAPTFYVGFGSQPTIGKDLALPPGVGIVLDIRVPNQAIYIGQGPFVNTGGSVVIQGVVKEGGISDPMNDTANIPATQALLQLVTLLKQALQLQ